MCRNIILGIKKRHFFVMIQSPLKSTNNFIIWIKIFGQFCLVNFCTFILKSIHLTIPGSTILVLLKQCETPKRVWKQDQIELTTEAHVQRPATFLLPTHTSPRWRQSRGQATGCQSGSSARILLCLLLDSSAFWLWADLALCLKKIKARWHWALSSLV